jgi:hypothetical protein
MKIKCCKCLKEQTGRLWKLRKNGWLVVHIQKGVRYELCNDCKPLLYHKKDSFQNYSDWIKDDLKIIRDKIKVSESL